MKKKITFLTLVLCFIGLNVFFALNDVKSDSSWKSILGMKQAIADEEGGGGGGWFYEHVDYLVHCGVTNWELTEYYNVYGGLVGTLYTANGVIQSSYGGSYSYILHTNGSIGERDLMGNRCDDGWNPFCTICSNPCAGGC